MRDGDPMAETILETALRYAAAKPPAEVQTVMRLSALDWAACGIAGAAEGSFAPWAGTLGGTGPCVGFDGARCGPAEAALVNGTLSHALDYDDTHFAHIGHPSVVVMSAALAVGQARGGALSEVLDAALVGAEASVAVGLWLGRGHYQMGLHQTATAGAFGACVAAARLLHLSDTQQRHALGLCASMASGLKAQFGTMGKPLNAGLAARAGVEAALWAEAGLTGAGDGMAAFGAAHHGAGTAVPFAWRMQDVSHKFHACCHGLHAALEAVRGADLAAAQRVQVWTHPRWLSVCHQPSPDTGLGVKFSYRHVLAMAALGHSTADINGFDDDCARDPALVAWRARVEVQGDASLSDMQARVEVDGVTYTHDLAAAMPYAARTARVRAKAEMLIGPRARDIWEALEANDLARFALALQPGA
ncbi:MAG: MmgE/PrpD family protein [Pseudomonadota bacterium]